MSLLGFRSGEGKSLEIAFSSLMFPSDALSIKRLRKLFPENFDGVGRIADGFPACNFFESFPEPPPEHQLALTQMLRDERIIAKCAFYDELQKNSPSLINSDIYGDEEREVLNLAEAQVSGHYQYFRLADSPETARFLIEQIRDEGIEQAKALISRSK